MASKAGLEPKPFFEIGETVMMKRWRLFIYIYIYIRERRKVKSDWEIPPRDGENEESRECELSLGW